MKQNLISKIIATLEEELSALKVATRETYLAATHEESKPENEYDTRGLEASYLAGAQSKRILELEERIFVFKNLEVKTFTKNQPISATALVKVRLNGKSSLVFIVPKGGGIIIHMDGQVVQTVTPSSPLGEALLGLKAHDVAAVEMGDQVREYEVLEVS